jgi:hypothetical protein
MTKNNNPLGLRILDRQSLELPEEPSLYRQMAEAIEETWAERDASRRS